MSLAFKSAVAAVLSASILFSWATTAAAVLTCSSKTYLDLDGFHGAGLSSP